ncbi:UDP-N-acetylmuramate--L-alanine ligase [Patescibacteria group bacterium]|nr:UDP-N-acetylmuramate--L-alanine ligase [Patescibacteria group bacterium]
MNLDNIKKVYFSGIGGIGVSALARFFRSKKIEVFGSDLAHSEITSALENTGMKIFYSQVPENIDDSIDLVVFSSAVPADNPELVRARELNIPQKSYFEILGDISRDFETITISGTNGKSTTTAMIASILIDAEKDPTVIVGSTFSRLDNNFRAGDSNLFVVEGCEYRGHMLLLHPKTIILTNIEEDHLDFYKDINHIVQTFQQYINSLKDADNLLVYNNDDVNIRKLTLPDCKKISFGLINGADVWANNIRKIHCKQIFNVYYEEQDLGEFELSVPGNFNIYNALSAIACSLGMNIPIGRIKDSLREYTGIWRRFEIVKNDEIAIISDYAHHPTAVQATIEAAKEFFPGRRLVVIFQPHQHDRTKKLFDDFIENFSLPDVVIMPEIFEVRGREELNTDISSKDLVEAIKKANPEKQIFYAKDLSAAVEKANSLIIEKDVVLVMGAGDVYKICPDINLKK